MSKLCEYEEKVLLAIATDSWQYIIPGAALNQAIEALIGSGYLYISHPDQGEVAVSTKGQEYIDASK